MIASLWEKKMMNETSLPAPVVPPSLFDASTAGDWYIVKSRPATVISSSVAFGSTKPRFADGMGWEKRKNVSAAAVSYYVLYEI